MRVSLRGALTVSLMESAKWLTTGGAVLLAGLGLAGTASSETDTGPKAAQPDGVRPAAESATHPGPPPTVDFDRLLRLPSSFDVGGSGRYGGSTSTNWRNRFAEAREAVEKYRGELAEAEERLGRAATGSSQWQMGAPGLANPDSEHATVSYTLRAQIRTLREEVETAEKGGKELRIEADLAGVPESWRRPEGEPPPQKKSRATDYELGS